MLGSKQPRPTVIPAILALLFILTGWEQWRICFVWRGNDAYEVEIVDYH